MYGKLWAAITDDVNTMDPPPAAAIAGMHALIATNALVMLIRSSFVKLSASPSNNGVVLPRPTVLTQMSKPMSPLACATAAATSSSTNESPAMCRTDAPAGATAASSDANAAMRASSRLMIVIDAPSASSARAPAPPMPPAPPMISALFPCRGRVWLDVCVMRPKLDRRRRSHPADDR